MSSQHSPITTPPVRRVGRRSVAGPVVLIVLGVVLLLANFGYRHSIGLLFARYWPLLIILWGLVKLLEHYRARREGYAASGIGAGGVLLLVLLIIFGLGATKAARVDWGQVSKDWEFDSGDGIFGPWGTPYTFTDEQQLDFPAGASLRVVSDRGDITVVPWDEDRIKVNVQKKVMSHSEANAKQISDATRPTVTVSGNQVVINANTSGARSHRVDTNLEIHIPRKAAVDIADGHGNILVHDRAGDLTLSTAHGDVDVADIQGNLSLSVRKGSVRASKISGDVNLSGTVNDAALSDISGAVQLSGDYFGDLTLSHVGKNVRFNSSRTDLELARLDGELAMESGNLRIQGLFGPTRITTRSKDIRLEDVSGDLQVQNSNGDVEVMAGKAPLGNITVDNRKGDVRVVLPANSAFRVDGRTYRGDISTDFGSLKINSTEPEASITGTVGSGGPQVRITTEHADIEVRKG